ncbi:hypothetical protein E4U42_000642 [Claviceps africana]|uniref:Uncharacterized protein n=1 Tax=Claviceps africana TaxID=83212 RepID=A0A8K0JBD5_9HYPO|nr:hypothetical protein E4U42_000642 [Claviceps africana]
MNVQILRSACARAKPEVQKTGLALNNYFRDFSTSGSLADDNTSVRQRSRAATSEINSFVKRGGSLAAARPLASQLASATQPRVLDVRSLPRGLGTRGRGAFRGRGQGQVGTGPQGQYARTQSPASGPGNRFSRPGGASAGRGSGLRAGRGGRVGGRGGRTGAAPKARREKKEGSDESDKMPGKRVDPFEVMDPYEEQFDKDMRFGTSTVYQPSLTLDSLAAFAPAVPTSEAGRKATVLGNLCALGTGDPVGTPQDLPAASYAADLEAHGVRFFADSKARDAAEGHLQQKQDKAGEEEQDGSGGGSKDVLVSGAEQSVRDVIFEQAVRGQHEKMAFATGPAAIARTWHLRAETWRKSDVDKFERKLVPLLSVHGGIRRPVKTVQA